MSDIRCPRCLHVVARTCGPKTVEVRYRTRVRVLIVEGNIACRCGEWLSVTDGRVALNVGSGVECAVE